jgi:hypothetical protein
MTASINLPLIASGTINATCAVHNRFERDRNADPAKLRLDPSIVYIFLAFLNSSIIKNRWSDEVSKRGREALFRLDRFRELQPNWDSYNAAVPADTALKAAEKFIMQLDRKGIPPYFVSPGPNGDVMVQYKCDNGHEAELWFEKDGSSVMLLITPDKPPYEAALDMEFLQSHLAPTETQGRGPGGE